MTDDQEARLAALETTMRQIVDRHARYQKIKSLENKLTDALGLIADLNAAIPFPFPEWFSADLQKRVIEVFKK
jgi:hypothetical protein